jgi:hypothetical protein
MRFSHSSNIFAGAVLGFAGVLLLFAAVFAFAAVFPFASESLADFGGLPLFFVDMVQHLHFPLCNRLSSRSRKVESLLHLLTSPSCSTSVNASDMLFAHANWNSTRKPTETIYSLKFFFLLLTRPLEILNLEFRFICLRISARLCQIFFKKASVRLQSSLTSVEKKGPSNISSRK